MTASTTRRRDATRYLRPVAVPVSDPLAPLRRTPASTGLFTDFDGTLSPIVADPATAAPLRGSADLLATLAGHFAVVAVISGRPASFLADHLPPSVVAVGLYGLEVRRDGKVSVDPAAERWRTIVTTAAARCDAAAPTGLVVESKGLSLTLHYRLAPELEDRARALADDVAADTGLIVRPARRSVELHPPVATDKGTALRGLASGLRAACFLGDDLGDLPAFHTLDELAADGVDVVKVAVRSSEAPTPLLDAADVIVEAPAGAVALLRTLLPSNTWRAEGQEATGF